MGTFLGMSGVIGVGPERVLQVLAARYEKRGATLEPLARGEPEFEHFVVVTEGRGGTTVLYPSDEEEWDEHSLQLSRALSAPVFSLHVHDGDLWMYLLYRDGEIVDQFNPRPDYWSSEIDDEEREKWRGRADVVAGQVPGASPDRIARYLVFWTDELSGERADPADEFAYGEDWQIVDFMRAVGLEYGSGAPGEGGTIYLIEKV